MELGLGLTLSLLGLALTLFAGPLMVIAGPLLLLASWISERLLFWSCCV